MKIYFKIIQVAITVSVLISCSSTSIKKIGKTKVLNPTKLNEKNDKLDFTNLKSFNHKNSNKLEMQKTRSIAEETIGEVTKSQLATSNSLISMLPTQNLKNAVREYLQMIGLESYEHDSFGSENSGLAAYNLNLIGKNPCFAKLVSYYYFNVFKKNSEQMKNYTTNSTYLFENLSSNTKNQDLDSGWIWKFANDLTQNDNNLSMNLIGICGHDNTAQLGKSEDICKEISNVTICESVANTLSFYNQNHKAQYPSLVNQYAKIIKEKWQPQDDQQEFLKRLVFDEDFLEDMNKGLSCPFVGPFYLQGSLSEKSILDLNLVNEIASIQAPKKGAKFLPSKYYHTIGGAFTSCSLVQNGVPQFLIRKIQSVAVNTYRMNRLCEMYSFSQDYSDLNMSLKEIIAFVKEFRDEQSLCIVGQYDDGGNKYDYEKPICSFLQDYDSLITGANLNYIDLEKKIERKLHVPIAEKMFKENISKEQCLSPQLTYSHIIKIKEVADNQSYCERGISPESCDLARDILKTWWIDFKWSEAQQMKGVEFAVENCKPESNYIDTKLEQKSCEILKTLEN